MSMAFDPGAPGGDFTGAVLIIRTDGGGHILGVAGLPPGMSCIVDNGYGDRYPCPQLNLDDDFDDDDDDDDDFSDDDDSDLDIEIEEGEPNEWEEVGEEDTEDNDEWCDDDDDDDDDSDDDDDDFDDDDGPLDMILAYALWD